MVKTYKNLELLARDVVHELSILESRKHNQAVVCSNSGGLQSRSTPQRMVCAVAVKQTVVKEDFGNPLH
jgi:hypothetical protein